MAHSESSKSADARPPVQNTELDSATDAICPYHKGLISLMGDREGSVFWCPIGRQYWRYRKNTLNGFTTRLNYPKRTGIV